jgi:hypothetical protein
MGVAVSSETSLAVALLQDRRHPLPGPLTRPASFQRETSRTPCGSTVAAFEDRRERRTASRSKRATRFVGLRTGMHLPSPCLHGRWAESQVDSQLVSRQESPRSCSSSLRQAGGRRAWSALEWDWSGVGIRQRSCSGASSYPLTQARAPRDRPSIFLGLANVEFPRWRIRSPASSCRGADPGGFAEPVPVPLRRRPRFRRGRLVVGRQRFACQEEASPGQPLGRRDAQQAAPRHLGSDPLNRAPAGTAPSCVQIRSSSPRSQAK